MQEVEKCYVNNFLGETRNSTVYGKELMKCYAENLCEKDIIGASSLEDSKFAEVLLTIDNIKEKSRKQNKYIASKLHKQFGYPRGKRLIDLIETAGVSDKDLLDMANDLDKSCEICEVHKKQGS